MAKDRYIWIGGVNVPVTEDVYRACKRAEWREDKQDAVRLEKECSFDFMVMKEGSMAVVSCQVV
jgi:hypothetical protein